MQITYHIFKVIMYHNSNKYREIMFQNWKTSINELSMKTYQLNIEFEAHDML